MTNDTGDDDDGCDEGEDEEEDLCSLYFTHSSGFRFSELKVRS